MPGAPAPSRIRHDALQFGCVDGSGGVADVFGAEELAHAAVRAARRYVAEMQRRGGLPPGAGAADAARAQAIAMLRNAAWIVQNEESDADPEDELDAADVETEFGDDDDD